VLVFSSRHLSHSLASLSLNKFARNVAMMLLDGSSCAVVIEYLYSDGKIAYRNGFNLIYYNALKLWQN
jgi:hypothetical protein